MAYFSTAHNDGMVMNLSKVRPVSLRELLRLVSNKSLCGTVGAGSVGEISRSEEVHRPRTQTRPKHIECWL